MNIVVMTLMLAVSPASPAPSRTVKTAVPVRIAPHVLLMSAAGMLSLPGLPDMRITSSDVRPPNAGGSGAGAARGFAPNPVQLVLPAETGVAKLYELAASGRPLSAATLNVDGTHVLIMDNVTIVSVAFNNSGVTGMGGLPQVTLRLRYTNSHWESR